MDNLTQKQQQMTKMTQTQRNWSDKSKQITSKYKQ